MVEAQMEDVFCRGPDNPHIVETRMLIKIGVLGRDEGLDQFFWDLVDRHHRAPLQIKLTDQAAVFADHLGNDGGLIISQPVNFGEGRKEVNEIAGQKEYRDAADDGAPEKNNLRQVMVGSE